MHKKAPHRIRPMPPPGGIGRAPPRNPGQRVKAESKARGEARRARTRSRGARWGY